MRNVRSLPVCRPVAVHPPQPAVVARTDPLKD
jgi:hypothetical protein